MFQHFNYFTPLCFRQVEERRRVEEDEIWRHMCNCHQGTMESYLEDIIVRSVDQTADEQVCTSGREVVISLWFIAIYGIIDDNTMVKNYKWTLKLKI